VGYAAGKTCSGFYGCTPTVEVVYDDKA